MVETASPAPTCERHGEATRLRCVDCDAPVCPRCMVRTEVGLKCENDATPGRKVKAAPSPTRRPLAIALIVVGALAVLVPLVLSLGGDDDPTTTAPPAGPAIGTWATAPSLLASRGTATATALGSGEILVAGGGVGARPVAAAELLDEDGAPTATGDLAEARRGHRSVLLDDGTVLVAGGFREGDVLDAVEIYDPSSGEWRTAAPMTIPRLGHSLVLLRDGRVLAAGGDTPDAAQGSAGGQTVRATAAAEIYDPAADAWEAIGDMGTGRFEHTATLLDDGRVLVAGGLAPGTEGLAPTGTAELFDPATGSWSGAGELARPRTNAAATRLGDGRVLVVGGASGPNADVSIGSTEIFDPRRGSWTSVGSLRVARSGLTATTLDDGTVLVAGGEAVSQGTRRSLNAAERYDPETEEWANAGEMECPRSEHAAVLLADGRVAIIAGDAAFPGEPPVASPCVDLYTP